MRRWATRADITRGERALPESLRVWEVLWVIVQRPNVEHHGAGLGHCKVPHPGCLQRLPHLHSTSAPAAVMALHDCMAALRSAHLKAG
jgi:hypothetical protein